MGFFFGIASLILTAASTAYGVVSQIQSANAAAEQQRKNAEAQSDNLRAQAEQEEQNQLQRSMVARRQTMRRIAAAEAGYAASGVSVSGTPTDSLGTMAAEAELDTVMEESASGQKRRMLLTDADNVLSLGYSGASLTQASGLTSAVGMGLSGMAGVARQGYEMSSYGRDGKDAKGKKNLF